MKIVKNSRFIVQYQHWILGFIWLCFGIAFFLKDEPLTFAFFGYLFLAFGQVGLHLYYKKKGRDKEFISWSENQLVVQELFQKPKIYPFSKIDTLTLTRNNLIIKSGPASGVMLALKGFHPEDIEKLRSEVAVMFPYSEMAV